VFFFPLTQAPPPQPEQTCRVRCFPRPQRKQNAASYALHTICSSPPPHPRGRCSSSRASALSPVTSCLLCCFSFLFRPSLLCVSFALGYIGFSLLHFGSSSPHFLHLGCSHSSGSSAHGLSGSSVPGTLCVISLTQPAETSKASGLLRRGGLSSTEASGAQSQNECRHDVVWEAWDEGLSQSG
jgi:hypothetical protein